jgi:flagellar M-ring protein FliF
MGAGRFRASVSADCDLTSGEQSEESFDPSSSVMVTSQKTEDTSSSTRALDGIPGTTSNLPETAPRQVSGGGTGTSRKTENVNYQTSRTVKRTVLSQGAIKHLSVSILIDQDAHWEGTGAKAKHVLDPPSADRLKVIRDLAAAATGLNVERGDQLIVESLPFESTLNLDPPEGPLDSTPASGAQKLTLLEQLKHDPKMAAVAGTALVVIVGGCFFVLRRKKKTVSGTTTEVLSTPATLPQAPGEKSAPALAGEVGAQDSWTPSLAASPLPALGPGKMEVLTKHVKEAAQKDTEICAGVLRGWLKEERA